MDFSGALANGWIASLNDLVQKNFKDKTVPQLQKESMLQLCSVHYKNNVNKVSKMSKIIPPKERGFFKKLCLTLLLDNLNFYQFQEIVNGIVTKFPNARGWIKWYMRASIAPHIFPACNSALDDPILGERLKKLSKDTNLQEGTGSALKTFLGGHKNHPNELIQGIFRWVREMSTQHRLAKQGIYTLSKGFQKFANNNLYLFSNV